MTDPGSLVVAVIGLAVTVVALGLGVAVTAGRQMQAIAGLRLDMKDVRDDVKEIRRDVARVERRQAGLAARVGHDDEDDSSEGRRT